MVFSLLTKGNIPLSEAYFSTLNICSVNVINQLLWISFFRTSCHQLTWQMATTKNNSDVESQLQATKEAYQLSCQILGNYYALHAQTKNEVKLALPYYRLVFFSFFIPTVTSLLWDPRIRNQ